MKYSHATDARTQTHAARPHQHTRVNIILAWPPPDGETARADRSECAHSSGERRRRVLRKQPSFAKHTHTHVAYARTHTGTRIALRISVVCDHAAGK